MVDHLTIETKFEPDAALLLYIPEHFLRRLSVVHRSDVGVRAERCRNDFLENRIVDHGENLIRQGFGVPYVHGNPDVRIFPALAPARSVERHNERERKQRGFGDGRYSVQRATDGAEALGASPKLTGRGEPTRLPDWE